MNQINLIQVNPLNFAPATTHPAQQHPTVEAVRALATQIRGQTAILNPLVNNFYTAWMVLPQAHTIAASSIQMLKDVFLQPHENHADFLHKLKNCTDDVRHDARDVARLAISLNKNNFEALEVASHLLEQGPNNLLIDTPWGPMSLSKQAIDINLLYQLTGDIDLLQGPQPGDQGNLAALHAEWEQDDALDPYGMPS